MTDIASKYDIPFYQLVVSLHAGTMQHLGKVASPVSGNIERDMEQAKQSIDLLEMLSKKTDGNLNEDEKKLLDHVLYELRMNYLDETQKDTAGSGDKKSVDEVDEKSEEKPENPDSPE